MESELQSGLRPSHSLPSLKAPGTRPASVRSTGSRGGSYRHGLLKLDHPTDISTKDSPIPPILTQGPSEPIGTITMEHQFSNVSVPTRRSSIVNIASRSEGDHTVNETRRPVVVCIDPTMHPPGMHANIHHPGLVSGADFCEAGLPVDRDSPITTPPRRLSPVGMSDNILTGRVYRILSGGDICEDKVDVSDHIHNAHSSAVKVRPALGLLPNVEPHEGHSSASKIQLAPGKTRHEEIIHQSETLAQTNPAPDTPYVLEHLHHGHSLIPKVRPFLDLASPSLRGSEPHDKPAAEQHLQQDEGLSRETSYWGFLPKLGEKKYEKVNVSDEALDYPILQADHDKRDVSLPESKDRSPVISRVENRPSLSASQYSASLKSYDVIPKTIAKLIESIDNQENIQNDNESIKSFRKTGNTSFSQENGRGREVSTSSVSPTSRPRPAESERDDQEHGILPEGMDPRRAASWLRRLLGYPESDTPNLTQLPEKSHPRHEDHASRVTTFSGQNEADIGAMATTVRKLERLLSEALSLANEVTEQDPCIHADDRKYSSHLLDTLKEAQPSIYETAGLSLKDDVRDSMLTKTYPSVFVGAIEGVGHGCEAIPSGSAKSHKLIKPSMRSGNIRQSPYQVNKRLGARGLRKSKRRHVSARETRHHVPDDDCVLPMPPPDNKIKRQHLSPIPHAYDEDDPIGIIKHRTKDVPNSREVREYIRVFHQPPITPRRSSRNLRKASQEAGTQPHRGDRLGLHRKDVDVCSLGGSDDVIDFSTQYNSRDMQEAELSGPKKPAHNHDPNSLPTKTCESQRTAPTKRTHELRHINLHRRSHVSIRDGQRFSLAKSVKRQPTIARDWSPIRKGFVASVACISTALVGILIGIYAGLVPSIQYFIADFNHYSIIGNVGLYLGMALSSFFCWPLPLLHGRKTYIVCSLCVAMPLLFPQAITVSVPRSPYTSVWRWALLLPRAIMGFALGFANMNFHSILTDLFGASLMCSNPHQEVVDHHDVRRHGGGLGVWLGIWTWCFIGSLGVGFLVGAVVIDSLRPSWGLYISIILIAVVLLLNVLCPEVRRSAWRRSVAEVRTVTRVSRRVARGEIMMHRVKDGPKWWGQEMYHGVALSFEMLRQPGFTIMAVYSAWIYAQVVLIIILLGSLTSRYYHLRSPHVGAAVSSVPIGALLAVPFQKANLFSRSRSTGPTTNSMTFDKKMTWSSHLVRRAIFVITLPIAGILYTIVSSGPPIHLDCSDLQPGMTGRSKSGKGGVKRMNYSSFPRVTAGWNTIHSIGFIFAAGATSVGGVATRSLGQRATTGVVASSLFIHSLLLLAVFARFRQVQIIPNSKTFEMDKWTEERRNSLRRRASAIAAAKANGVKDRPIILGNPSEKFRRMNILELGSLTRWSEIRKKNRLIDEGVHLNRQTVDLARGEIHQRAEMLGELVRKVSKRSMRSKRSHDSDHDDTSGVELRDIGPLGPPGAGLDHQHSSSPREAYFEHDCVMGQTVPEEADGTSSESDIDYGWTHTQEHSSHMMPKVRPYTGFEKRVLEGNKASDGDYVIKMDASQGEHASHMEPKVNPAGPSSSQQREQHRSHMQSKVKPVDESKVKPANTEFEDIDLGGKSGRKDSKTLKQD
ncbi:hypothetical protein F4776DRAFT_654594 [Hypoxylon sp. NC0597]|nr:hypothetical protein F4776DRAFT_654594 [Hypoxylon sp. NC0597]